MTRYYQDYNRKLCHESQLEHGYVYSCEQLHDICALLREGKYPDGTFSDAECAGWAVIKNELGLEF